VNLNLPEPSGPVEACTGIALPLLASNTTWNTSRFSFNWMRNFRGSYFALYLNLRYVANIVLCFESLLWFLLIPIRYALPSFHDFLRSIPRQSMWYLLWWNFHSTFSSTELSSEVTVYTMQVYMWRGFLTLTLDEGEWLASSLAAFALGRELQVRTVQESEWPRCHFRKERHLLGKFLASGSHWTMIPMVSSL
jgi:hypothetical protein